MYVELPSGLTDEQEMLRSEVRRFGAEVLRPASLQLDTMSAEDVIAPGSPMWDAWKAWYGLGNHTGALAEAHGGLGLDAVAQHAVYGELGWAAADLGVGLAVSTMPFVVASTVAQLLGNERVVDEFVRPFAEDRDASMIGCWAITEPGHGSDSLGAGASDQAGTAGMGGCRARRVGGDVVLTGQKSAWVSNGTIATHALVFCTMDGDDGPVGGTVVLVPLDRPGVKRGAALEKHGQRALNQGEIFFDEVRVPDWCVLVPPDLYVMAREMTLALANSGMGALFTGLARAAFEEALAYARERVQGGRPICEHQMVQSKLFSMFSRYQAALAVSRATMVGAQAMQGLGALAHAVNSKVTCTEAAFSVASDAIQVHGGIGLARGMLVEKLLRDARSALIEDGVNEFLGLVAAGHIVEGYGR